MTEKTKQKNFERYTAGIERIITEFNLDFAGNPEHEKLMDEIEALAVNIRDPEDPSVIHPSAVYLATQEILTEKGMPTQPEPKPEEQAQKANQSVADKLFQRNKERYEQEMNWRKDPQSKA